MCDYYDNKYSIYKRYNFKLETDWKRKRKDGFRQREIYSKCAVTHVQKSSNIRIKGRKGRN